MNGYENQYGTIGKTCLGMPMNNSAVKLSPSPTDLSQYKTITYEYNWVNTTTPTGIIIDDQSELFDLPFTLDFYGKQYDYIYICSNGFLSFSASIDCTPDSIPNTAAPNGIIAPLWQDLNPGEGGSITYLSEADRFVVTWDHVPDYYSDVPQTFQVIIHKTGRIYFQYQDISFDSQTSIGIENSLGSAGKNIIESYVAIKFRPSGYDPTPCAYCRQNTTQASGITVDDQSKQFTLPFTLNFYGQNYNSIYVCSNGFLSLASSTDWSPDLIPGTNSPNGIMAPFWRDLDPSADGVITYLSDPNKFVVSWDSVPTYSYYGGGTPQSFQVIIHHSGEIIFQYREVNPLDGIITSIGIENQTGTQGHSYIFPNFPLIQFHPRHYTSLVWGFPDTSLRADEVNASYHVNVIHDYIHRTLDMADDDPNFIQVKVKVSTPNEPGYRPAIKTINLPAYNLDPFPYPGAARESDVVYHEYTHFFEHSIYGQDFINFIADEYTSQEAVAMTEGYADYMACALNNDPNINFPQGGVSRDISVFRRYPQDYIPPWEDLNRIAVHQNGLILANTLWDIRQAFDDPAITDADKVDADFLAVHSLLIEPLQFIDIREWFFCLDGFFYSGNHYQMIEDILNLHGINEEGYTLQEIVYSWIYGNQPSNILLDDHIEMVNLLFTFNFYGQEYTTVCVSDNGFICFDPDENDPSSPNPVPLPNIEKPNAVIAPFWTDFDPTPFIPGLSRIEYLNDADKFVVAWRNVKDKIHAFDDPENNYSFQVILHNNGDIVFQYNSTFPTNTTFPHTIGIENESGLKCIPHLEYISGPFALKFFHK